MTIDGKIAKIVDEYHVVVNRGSEHGVEEGMDFIVYREEGSVQDPDTGEELGELEHPLARLKPEHIMEKMTLMASNETEVRTESVFNLPTFQKKKKVNKPLPVDENETKREEEDTIEVGDLVKSV